MDALYMTKIELMKTGMQYAHCMMAVNRRINVVRLFDNVETSSCKGGPSQTRLCNPSKGITGSTVQLLERSEQTLKIWKVTATPYPMSARRKSGGKAHRYVERGNAAQVRCRPELG